MFRVSVSLGDTNMVMVLIIYITTSTDGRIYIYLLKAMLCFIAHVLSVNATQNTTGSTGYEHKIVIWSSE